MCLIYTKVKNQQCHITFASLLYPPHITCMPVEPNTQYTPIPDHTGHYTALNQTISQLVNEHKLGRPMNVKKVGFTNSGQVKMSAYTGVYDPDQSAPFSHCSQLTHSALLDWSQQILNYFDAFISFL